MASVQETIGSPNWVIDNFLQVRDVFPVQPTQVTQQLILQLGFKLKCLGVDWRSSAELGQAMVLCMHLGMYRQRVVGDGVWVERSARTIPSVDFFKMSPEQITTNRLLRTHPPEAVVQLAREIIAGIQLMAKTKPTR